MSCYSCVSTTTTTTVSTTTTIPPGVTCNSVISYIYPVNTFPVSNDIQPTSFPPFPSLRSCVLYWGEPYWGGPSHYVYSPTAIVNTTSSETAIWFLTSPNSPMQSYTDDYLFTPYGHFTGGDVCYATGSTLEPTLYYNITVSGPTPYDVSIQNFHISDIGEFDLFNSGYFPLVDNTLSNGFNTKSYIFDHVPSYVQHGVWTWAAEYAHLPDVSNTMEISYSYTEVNTITCYNSLTGAIEYTYTINTPLTANFVVTVNNLENTVIPYNVITGENSYTTFNTPILPYILYDFSMPSPGSLNLPMYMNMSYDTFSPWTYNEPQKFIEPFPIDTGSRFFVNYNNVLVDSNPNEITKMPWLNRLSWLGGIPDLHKAIPNYINPNIPGVISIAATPNNYIYVLNYSSSQNTYFLTMLRLVPRYYYNTTDYQPDSVGNASSLQQWNEKWNSYWANVIALQNSSVYVVNSINLDNFNNNVLSTFQPLNISVDDFGDVFITGSSFFGPALAEITNTLVNNNWAVVYNNSIETNSNDQIMPEIAVSPTGSLIFLANQNDGGYIYVYSSTNFTQIDRINLAYVVYSGGIGGGVPLATLNIYSWLSNNGLYNQSLPSELWNKSNFVNKKMVLDLPEYHHPLGIADINGYLYVLDEWAGGIGVSPPSWYSWILKLFGKSSNSGVYFNILTLRVLNSTGSNIPINPNHFNDMYTVQECGKPYYLTPSNTINPSTCYPTTEYSKDEVSCSTDCELVATLCAAEPKAGIPGYHYSCISPNTQSNTYYSLAPSYYATGSAYPPYGWILAANISGGGTSINFCSAKDIDICNFNPVNLNPANYPSGANYYNGSYYPIGPQLRALDTEYSSIGFSVNFNDSVDILLPSGNPNTYSELILTKLNVENYTKLFGGFPPYNCLTDYQNTVCDYNMSVIDDMNPPVYTAADAFKYLESLGTPQIMPIESIAYSIYSGNGPSSSLCGNVSESAKQIENGETCGSLNSSVIVPNAYSNISSSPSSPPLPGLSEYLNSWLTGYVLIPYTYNVFISNSIASKSYQVFTYQTVNSGSNPSNSLIEGGDTYLRYINNKYYVPNLSDYGTILPKDIIADLLTDRNFTNIYINVTNRDGLYQIAVNGSKIANFEINQFYIGSHPIYESISSLPENLFGEDALQMLLPNSEIGQGIGYYYEQYNISSFVQLFDWYKSSLFTDALDIYLNQSPINPSGTALSGPFNARGYTRIIYVLNDKFNNTIYLPIDADIANTTQISLKVNPVVDPSNANQTTLYITGNATYFDGVKYVPLVDNSIYIYFNNNINYVQYNALLYPENAILCAYNSMVSGPCTLANPAFASLSQNANVITYYPQYNASGECGPPPTQLYSPPVYNCNIYGNGLPASCNPILLQNGQEITQWCIPLAYNGMGVCTSQIGLMGIATTDSNGNFSFTANACGIGTASITAEFYGYPYNEPITVRQPSLPDSATLYYNKQPNLVTFQVLDYTWSPNETTVSPVTIGQSVLSYGSISIIWLIGVAAIAVILMYLTEKFKKD